MSIFEFVSRGKCLGCFASVRVRDVKLRVFEFQWGNFPPPINKFQFTKLTNYIIQNIYKSYDFLLFAYSWIGIFAVNAIYKMEFSWLRILQFFFSCLV